MAEQIADIAFNVPLKQLYSYRVPPGLQTATAVGMRVRASFGRRNAVGLVVRLRQGDGEGLKEVAELIDAEPLIPASLLKLLRWAADYYCHPLGQVVKNALPGGLGQDDSRANIQTEPHYRLTDSSYQPRGKKQLRLLELLAELGPLGLSRIRQECPAPHAALKRLVAVGCLEETRRERIRDPFAAEKVKQDQGPDLNQHQQAACAELCAAINRAAFTGFLLHGVTGSGKTEVYLHAVQKCLEEKRQALILVPEISLTPQLVSRFRARFEEKGVGIAVLHSGLSVGERYDAWREIVRHRMQIVIGARSAVFAPLPALGLIVVDEEHDTSFKQGEGFRYNARDLALVRGQQSGCPVVLGSATPSIASSLRAEQGHFKLLQLPQRVHRGPLPKVEIVDMREEKTSPGALSNRLIEALQQTLEQERQCLLLLNRRGFAPFLLCADCGHTFYCPNCSITLTFHQRDKSLKCHYCDYTKTPDDKCPKCQGLNLDYQGVGTERLEQELRELFSGARIARMDRDTTSRKGAHQEIMQAMLDRRVDILIGTQMIAKGHDFPAVDLVGVIAADTVLNFPDFRSAERGFALLTQVAGRAGRGHNGSGRVLVQTFNPEHYALACALKHDYAGFYQQEIPFRQELGYPPCGHLINLTLSGNRTDQVKRAAERYAARLRQASAGVEILGPTPCPLARLRGKSRYQILLKAAERTVLRRLLPQVEQAGKDLPRQVAVQIDVDPLDML